MEGIDIESEEAPEVLSQVLEVLRQYLSSGEPGIDSLTGSDAPLAKAVCSEILVRVSTAPKAFAALKDASGVMVIAGADDRALQVRRFFSSLLYKSARTGTFYGVYLTQAITLLMALHVPQIAGKAARALPRYTDIIVADVGKYF